MTENLERTRLFKMLLKYFGVHGGDPTSQELEQLSEVQGRVKVVVKSRWIMLILLLVYGLYAGIFFSLTAGVILDRSQLAVIAISVCSVYAYNLLLQLFYRELCHLKFIGHLQVLLDIFFVTILIHFTGGALSWFWTVYLIVTLEASFLFDETAQVWVVGAIGSLIFGALLGLEYTNLIPSLQMPFADTALHHSYGYIMLLWFWVAIMNATMAIIGGSLMRVIRNRERELRVMVVKDQMTNLYNRSYFFKMLNSEIQRSIRYQRVFSVILLDLDDFKVFNDTYGHLQGDELLKQVAAIFRRNVRRSETDPPYDIDIPCRYGGEEFAIILPETPAFDFSDQGATVARSAMVFAERIRKDVADLRFAGHTITVSIGIAMFPLHGETPDILIKAADDALYEAKRRGKNKVVLAHQPDYLEAPIPFVSPEG